jgi:hypothetical protein
MSSMEYEGVGQCLEIDLSLLWLIGRLWHEQVVGFMLITQCIWVSDRPGRRQTNAERRLTEYFT